MKNFRAKKFFPICALLLSLILLVTACNGKAELTLQPTPTPQPLTQNELLQAYSNEAYDYSFVPLELKGFSDSQFDPWIRPVLPALFAKDTNTLFATYEVRSPAILCGKYVITSSGAFQVAPNLNNEQLYLGAVLIWGITETAEGNQLETENIKLVKMILTDFGIGIAILERSPSKYPMPPENTCPFPIGNTSELEPLHKLLILGQTKGEGTSIILPWRQGAVTYVNRNNGELKFWGSTWVHDWGSPIFALRDGNPELVGLTVGGWLGYQGYETKSFGLTIERIFSIVKEELGIELKGLPSQAILSASTATDTHILRVRQELLTQISGFGDLYAQTLQYFDLTGQKSNTDAITQCVEKVTVLTNDDKGAYFAQRDGFGFIFGEYLFIHTSTYPSLPPPNIPPSLSNPNATPEEQKEALVEFQKEMDRLAKFTHMVMILWPSDGPAINLEFAEKIEIKDTALSFELEKLGVRVLKRVPTFDGTGKLKEFPACNFSTARFEHIETQDFMAGVEEIITPRENDLRLGIATDAYQGKNSASNEFYFQGSASWRELILPLFALNNETHKWEVVGLITQSFSPAETRGRAVRMDKILQILSEIKAQQQKEMSETK